MNRLRHSDSEEMFMFMFKHIRAREADGQNHNYPRRSLQEAGVR